MIHERIPIRTKPNLANILTNPAYCKSALPRLALW
jgi:hypothetical protein